MYKMSWKIAHTLLILGIIFNFDGSHGMVKKFVSSWDMSNGRNWKYGIMPCSNSQVSLAIRPDNSILIDKNTQIDSLILGHDSRFIIADDKMLSFGQNARRSCHEDQKNTMFRNKAKGFWWDPESWSCRTSLDCNLATPHVTRVPCDRDSVRFPDPQKSLYEIIISGNTPTVADLRIKKNSDYTKYTRTSQFTEFALTDDGQKLIKKHSDSSSYVYIEDRPSCPLTGCRCHSVSPIKEVCKIMSKKCSEAECQKPITINGFCCDICGSSLRISHNGTLAIDTLKNLLRQTLSQAKDVDGHVASLDEVFYDVIFVPKSAETDYIGVSKAFRAAFNAKLNKDGFHASLLITSGESFVTTSKGSSLSYLILFAILFAIGAAAGAVYVKKYRRNSITNFDFRRFSLRGRRESTLSTVTLSSSSAGQGIRFTNPIFNVPEAIPEQEISDTPIMSEAQLPNQRTNPLFDVENKDKVISLASLKEKLDPDVEEEHVEKTSAVADLLENDKTSLEPKSPTLIKPMADDNPFFVVDKASEDNLIDKSSQSFEDNFFPESADQIEVDKPLVESVSSTHTNPFAASDLTEDFPPIPEIMEQKVEIEPLESVLLNVFPEEETPPENTPFKDLSFLEGDGD